MKEPFSVIIIAIGAIASLGSALAAFIYKKKKLLQLQNIQEPNSAENGANEIDIQERGDIVMPNGSMQSEVRSWRTGYNFALLLLVFLGISLIVIGAQLFPQGSLFNVIFIGVGISMGPAAIVAGLFRMFLFQEVQYQLTFPVISSIKERITPEVREQVIEIVDEYRKEIAALHALRDAGIIRPYRRRVIALREFATSIDAETSEIMVVGSSLKGLLQKEEYKDIADKLRFKILSSGVHVKFLLTHPVVADLRAGQEARRSTEIGNEIVKSLLILKEWGVPPEDVRLYKGTPTCFAIKTKTRMFLNPYPYGTVAFDSPCLIVEASDLHPTYFYDEFTKSHFSAWDTSVTTRIFDYDATIQELQQKLNIYSELVQNLLQT